jgi:L-ribulose-5-phosphate 3-epimerase
MKNKQNALNRRTFIKQAGIASGMISLMSFDLFSFVKRKEASYSKRKIYLFSKHLHWLSYTEMSAFISELGFDGVDLTVREGGHVEPGKVAGQLPMIVEVLKKAGKPIKSIATGILNVKDEHTESILKTASQSGIESYRMGWYNYEEKENLKENLESFEQDLRALSKLNEKYKIKGAYQNHAGSNFGASIWDLGNLLQKINSPYLGCQFDIRHATVEGAYSWKTDFKHIKPFIHSLDIKDFTWTREGGKVLAKNVPLGEGMVDFETYFKLIKNLPDEVPLILHLEYPLGGAEEGHKQISISPEAIKKAMKKDLEFIKARL